MTQGKKWSGAGSNRRHMDFQSIALPTELPDRASNRGASLLFVAGPSIAARHSKIVFAFRANDPIDHADFAAANYRIRHSPSPLWKNPLNNCKTIDNHADTSYNPQWMNIVITRFQRHCLVFGSEGTMALWMVVVVWFRFDLKRT